MDYDIRMIGRNHPKANLTCELCYGRGWLFIMYNSQVLTVQKCDECRVYENDIDAAVEAHKHKVNVRLEYPCYVLDDESYKTIVNARRTKGWWYHRYTQKELLLCQIFDENDKPITLVNVTDAERIVSGMNIKRMVIEALKNASFNSEAHNILVEILEKKFYD